MVEQMSARTQWLLDGASVPAPINQMMLHGGVNLINGASAGECYLLLGHATPPLIDPATLDPSAGELVIPVVPVGQFTVSYARLKDFHAVLGDFIAQQEQTAG